MVRKLLITLGLLGLIGCATTDENVYLGCSIVPEDGGQLIICYDQTLFIPSNDYISALVDPCGDGPGPDEIIIVFNNGTHLAWYRNLGIIILDPNVIYETTDAQKCKFIIENGKIIDETIGKF